MTYEQVVQNLESLSIMPKTMPGLEKLKKALSHKSWYQSLDSQKIITVAGTNGKGTTCAALEALLISAGQKVGLYTSPHLISTTERIRSNGQNISRENFIKLYLENENLIRTYQLTHFESLTLMAADYFFSQQYLDFAIFEVGLGGTYDATNVFPNGLSIITALGMDHQNILGNTIQEIASNKFGIIKKNSVVVHHVLPEETNELFHATLEKTDSRSVAACKWTLKVEQKNSMPIWFIDTQYGIAEINIPGARACENIATALTAFEVLGFNPQKHLNCLKQIKWQGRMQMINLPEINCPVFLSGDHNPQGVQSLIDLLKYYQWQTLHLVVGVGQDKDAENIFSQLLQLPRHKLYLTVTPFKGRALSDYSKQVKEHSAAQNENIIELLKSIQTKADDMILVTGSLYLVGEVLKQLSTKPENPHA